MSQKNRTSRWIKKFGFAFLFLVFVAAIFAPLLANDLPYLYIDNKGVMHFPVFENDNLYQGIDFKALAENGENVSIVMPLIPYSPTEYNLDESLLSPSGKHWLGTDEQGRDILSRLIHGARISLSVGFVAVGIYTLIGVFLGALAGYFGGKMDLWISRLIEVMICFPTFFLILAILSILENLESSLWPIMVVIGVTGWTGIARLVRGEFLQKKNENYVLSARALGYSQFRIMFRHILPNTLAPVIVTVTFGLASAILVESSLSFLGFGVPPSEPSWGSILSQSREYMDFAWWLTFFPGLAIFLTILSFHILGESLKERLQRGSQSEWQT